MCAFYRPYELPAYVDKIIERVKQKEMQGTVDGEKFIQDILVQLRVSKKEARDKILPQLENMGLITITRGRHNKQKIKIDDEVTR